MKTLILLRTLIKAGPVSWDSSTNYAARVSELQSAMGGLLTNFLDMTINADGVLADTNVVVRWTLPSVLAAVDGGSSWSTGTTPEQVAELNGVLAKLTHLVNVATNSQRDAGYYMI
jgi:hypothetical protein